MIVAVIAGVGLLMQVVALVIEVAGGNAMPAQAMATAACALAFAMQTKARAHEQRAADASRRLNGEWG